MTASAVASSVTAAREAPASSALENFIRPTNDRNNNTWKRRPFLLDLTPSLPPSANASGLLSSGGQNSELPRSFALSSPSSSSSSTPSASPFLSFSPLFQSWSQLPHSSMQFLRGNSLASGGGNGMSSGSNNVNRISAGSSSPGVLAVSQTTLSSSLAAQRGVVVSTAVKLSSASATATTATMPLHSTNKTTTATPSSTTVVGAAAASTATPTILTTTKRPVIIIYPTVSPESIVIPIVSCIFGFPLLALLVICCLRRRAKLARERDRRRNYDMQDHAVSLVRFSPIHRLNNRSSRAISLRPERSLSRGFPSLELDTVIEERSDPEQTQTDLLSPESPLDPQKFHEFHSS